MTCQPVLLFKASCRVCQDMVARHGRGRGARRDPQQGGGRGWFRSIAIPRRGMVVICHHVPAGIAVALMPCGAWSWQRIGAGLYASFVVIFNSFASNLCINRLW